MRRSIEVMVALVVAVTLANCGGGGDGAGNSACRGKIKRYIECGAWEGGALNCIAQPETDFDQCIAPCIEEASCPVVVQYACGGVPNACINACLDATFPCANGRRVSLLDQCDGENDCIDNSDESGCSIPKFHCDEFGEVDIPGTQVCDGSQQCSTAADEADCGFTTCAE